jgi:L-arabinokinase
MTWRFAPQPSSNLADSERFLAELDRHADFFDSSEPLWLGRASGRLDLMGGVADYSGSLVLELPLNVATWVAMQPAHDGWVTLYSTGAENFAEDPLVTFSLADLQTNADVLDYAALHPLFTHNTRQAWAAYVAGVLVLLRKERGLSLTQGVRIFVHSEVPAGKGVSSSASLEVATMQAANTLYDLRLEGRELAILCQQVENLIVGAPCGVMDQMTSACGVQGSLLALLCQPAELQGHVKLPDEVEIWGIDSGIRHAVTGADYGSVRVGAFMGYRIIADLADLAVQQLAEGKVQITDPLWHGFLANIAPSVWETTYRERVPLEMDGATFLARYGGTIDSVTRVDPAHVYAVRQPTAHPIYEHHRVQLFRALLTQRPMDEAHLCLLGELMYQSHASYSACGLGSAGTDRLVSLVRQAGPTASLYGAKVTGGGSGGTVAVLARRGARECIEHIVAQYKQETDVQASIIG